MRPHTKRNRGVKATELRAVNQISLVGHFPNHLDDLFLAPPTQKQEIMIVHGRRLKCRRPQSQLLLTGTHKSYRGHGNSQGVASPMNSADFGNQSGLGPGLFWLFPVGFLLSLIPLAVLLHMAN